MSRRLPQRGNVIMSHLPESVGTHDFIGLEAVRNPRP
jgi:hypothetical protein